MSKLRLVLPSRISSVPEIDSEADAALDSASVEDRPGEGTVPVLPWSGEEAPI